LSRRLAGCLALLLLPAFAEVKALKNFTLLDGSGGPAIAGAAMLIDNGRISWIGSTQRLNPPEGAEVLDLNGKFVMPGIINLHGHVGSTIDLAQDVKFFTRENIEKTLRTYASYGVTTVLSLGTDQDLIFQIRDQQGAGRPTYARVYSAGQFFTLKGGVGGMPGVTHDLTAGDAAHVFYLADAKQLVNGGVEALANSIHDQPVDQELIDSMKRHGTWQAAATLTREASMVVYAKPPAFLTDPFFTRSVSPAVLATLNDPDYQKKIAADPDFAKYSSFLGMAQQNLKRLADAGVKYGMGTDSGAPGRFPGFLEHWEMELMVEAGLTPSQVIVAATKNAAEFLRDKDLGTLEIGKWADLIVLGANPAANIRNTRLIEAVYVAGNRVAP
jgi:imidazolonepropionase-like amidohydrolase